MNQFTIPLHKPFWGKEEEKAAIAAIRTGTGVGDLGFSEQLANLISQTISVGYVLPTGSGTAALELACACILKKDDEVILPSFTFSSCANAVLLVGAKPVFCDIDINSYNIARLESVLVAKPELSWLFITQVLPAIWIISCQLPDNLNLR